MVVRNSNLVRWFIYEIKLKKFHTMSIEYYYLWTFVSYLKTMVFLWNPYHVYIYIYIYIYDNDDDLYGDLNIDAKQLFKINGLLLFNGKR
jgi:hypothetical protein